MRAHAYHTVCTIFASIPGDVANTLQDLLLENDPQQVKQKNESHHGE
jgi:hypothetical protein